MNMKTKVTLIPILLALVLSACAAPYTKEGISDEQRRQDYLDCKLEAAKVSGYDYIDKIMNQNDVKKACLEAKGYTKNKIR